MASIISAQVVNNSSQPHQRDDGTQIWHQAGQKSDVYSTRMPVEFYDRMQSANSAGLNGAGNAINLYPLSYSQRPVFYNAPDIYQNSAITYAAPPSVPPPNAATVNPHLAYNQLAMVAIPSSNGTAAFNCPPMSQQPTQMLQHQQGTHPGNISQSQNYYPPMIRQKYPVVTTTYMQSNAVGSNTNPNNYMKNNQPNNNSKQNGNSKLSMFDNCSENYTERWVTSTASIPQDLKSLPDQDQVLNSPTEYTSTLYNEGLKNGWMSDGRAGDRHQISVDEFATSSGAFSPANANEEMDNQDKVIEHQRNRISDLNLYSNVNNKSINNYSGQRYNNINSNRVNSRNSNRNFSSQNNFKKNYENGVDTQNQLNNGTISSIPGTAFYSRDYPKTMGANGINPMMFDSTDSFAKNNGDLKENVNEQKLSDSEMAANAAAAAAAGTTWADMVKRSGNCSVGETRLCTAPVTINSVPVNGAELGQGGSGSNRENSTEYNSGRFQRYINRNANDDRGGKNRNNNYQGNATSNGYNQRNRNNGRNRFIHHGDSHFDQDNNKHKSNNSNQTHQKFSTSASPNKAGIAFNINGLSYPNISTNQSVPSPDVGIIHSNHPSLLNQQLLSQNYSVHTTVGNYSAIPTPTTISHMNKWANGPILISSSVAPGTHQGPAVSYSLGHNVGWQPQQQQQQQQSGNSCDIQQSNNRLNQQQQGTILISQPSPQILLGPPAASGPIAPFGVNTIPQLVPAMPFSASGAIQPMPFLVCTPPGPHPVHVQEDKFKNMWLDQAFVPASQVTNERYIANFVNAHNNAIVTYKEAVAKDPNSQQHVGGGLLMATVQMMNAGNNDPRFLYLVGDHYPQKMKNGSNGKGRQHRNSINGAQYGLYGRGNKKYSNNNNKRDSESLSVTNEATTGNSDEALDINITTGMSHETKVVNVEPECTEEEAESKPVDSAVLPNETSNEVPTETTVSSAEVRDDEGSTVNADGAEECSQ